MHRDAVDGALGSAASANIFDVTQVCDLVFSVQESSGGTLTGTVQIQYSPNYNHNNPSSASWYDLDATNLLFSAAGQKTATWGQCHIRAFGASADDVDVWIGGEYVHRVEARDL